MQTSDRRFRRARLGTGLGVLITVLAVALGLTAAPSPAQGAAGDATIFGTTVPATPAASDPDAVELGVNFTPRVAGSIVGIRFYKGSGNSGTHTGSLWSSSGSRLATATFR